MTVRTPRRLRIRALVVAAVAGISLGGQAVTVQAQAATPYATAVWAYEARINTLVNVERRARGLKPLAASSCATTVGRTWSVTMARTGKFVHQALAPILSTCRARGVGENLAYGNISADAMMRMWMNSPGHRANILNPRYTHLGTGAARTSSGRWYGTQQFLTL